MMRDDARALKFESGSMRSINFAFDRYDLSEVSRATLRSNAALLKANTSVDVRLDGHTDERGRDSYNQRLGEKRARAAANYLTSVGIASARISTTSCGEKCPLDSAHNEAAWAANRRVELKTAVLE